VWKVLAQVPPTSVYVFSSFYISLYLVYMMCSCLDSQSDCGRCFFATNATNFKLLHQKTAILSIHTGRKI
jgi:hypothetical protein